MTLEAFMLHLTKNLLDIGENCKPFVVFQFYHSPSFLVTNSALLTVFVLKVKEGWLCNFGVKELTASSLVGIFLALYLNQRIKRTFLITCCLAGIYLSIFQWILPLLQNHKALLMTFTVTEVSGSFAMGDKSEIVKNVKYLYLKFFLNLNSDL